MLKVFIINSDRPDIVFCTGMHRSGTSLLARLLCSVGGAAPKDLMPPLPDNPEGFYESMGFQRLQDLLLATRGDSWDNASIPLNDPLPKKVIFEDKLAFLGESYLDNLALAVLCAASSAFDPEVRLPLILKDPRISLTWTFWKRLFSDFSIKIATVYIIRHPLAVAHSLAKRNSMSIDQGMRLWRRYIFSALPFMETADLIVNYDDLVSKDDTYRTEIFDKLARLSGVEAQFEQALSIERIRVQETFLTHPATLLAKQCECIYKAICENNFAKLRNICVEANYSKGAAFPAEAESDATLRIPNVLFKVYDQAQMVQFISKIREGL